MANKPILLTQFLTAPSKVASALDWKKTSGSVVSLTVGRDSLSVNLAQHPSLQEDSVPCEPIPIQFRVRNNRKVLDTSVTNVLHDLVHESKVCGFVVDWPLQKEGRMGASCGRVLHTLDSLLEAQIIAPSRRFCLWDGTHVAMEIQDKWGRCSLYGRKHRCSTPTVHFASREQYNTRLVTDMWYDFSRTHWPELYHARDGDEATHRNETETYHKAEEWLEHYEREGTYLRASSTRYDSRMISNAESTK